jgi:hypothetical protein
MRKKRKRDQGTKIEIEIVGRAPRDSLAKAANIVTPRAVTVRCGRKQSPMLGEEWKLESPRNSEARSSLKPGDLPSCDVSWK